ncbi:Hypothetical protein EIN_503400, partial [Entamoeba invadens IP1]
MKYIHSTDFEKDFVSESQIAL